MINPVETGAVTEEDARRISGWGHTWTIPAVSTSLYPATFLEVMVLDPGSLWVTFLTHTTTGAGYSHHRSEEQEDVGWAHTANAL